MIPRAIVFVVAICLLEPRGFSLGDPGSKDPGLHYAPVGIDVLVLSPEGTAISDLTKADFEVLADGSPVTIDSFAPSKTDLSIVMLIDGTSSQPLKRYEITAGVNTGFVASLRPTDRGRLAILGSTPTLTPWLPAERAAALSSLNAIRGPLDRLPVENSPIWDAIDMSVQALLTVPEPRVLLLMTDGRANGNRIGLDEAEKIALAAKVTISAVSEGGEWLIPQFGGTSDRARSDASLRRLADETGGLYLPDGTARRTLRAQMNAFAYVKEIVNTPSLPAPLVTQIISSLRTRYRIGFAGASDGNVHQIEVRVKKPNVEVRAPKLYVAPASLQHY